MGVKNGRYFVWVDAMETRGVNNLAGMNENRDELKAMVSRLENRVDEQLSAIQVQVNGVRKLVQTQLHKQRTLESLESWLGLVWLL
ncbi:unnamed protein product [Cuscuta epithymum]|uniref:t-SNARE coiled-coil homology domain-containing protein n=1 Tax=Cuscuta epithymum TaxID=186058 RepID=A0AAV0EIA4_9ASTE|nr:unnamed protein product [Cuscuta epithymum]